MNNDGLIIRTEGLQKTFIIKKGKAKGTVEAVKDVNLEVKKGEIFGFLGPNGAGKTTTLNMLTTILAPTKGTATVVGFDLHTKAKEIRKHIGYVSQAGGTDMSMNATENLVLQSRLYGIDKMSAKKRSDDLISRFQMTEFASRPASSYSGGQKRRLDLALGIVHSPDIVFLDEPTTGLDPQSRAYFWEEIRSINKEGLTIFVTTHYLDEADNLCDSLAIVDHGIIVAKGTTEELKRSIGGESIILRFGSEPNALEAKDLLSKEEYVSNIYIEEGKLIIFTKDGEKALVNILRYLDQHNLSVETVALNKPSLDDVFLQKTGRSLREGGEG